MRRFRLTALAVAASLAIAACSGSSAATPAAASITPSTAPAVEPSVAPSTTPGDAVSIANFSFQPTTVEVAVGTTVTWTNNDGVNHTVTADDGSFKSDQLGSGATFSQTFAKAGTFAYHCSIHPGMTGKVTVR